MRQGMATVWQGTVAPMPGAGSVQFQQAPGSAQIASVTASAPVTFTPGAGYPALQGNLISTWTAPAGQAAADIPSALQAAGLLLLDPAKSYTLTITEN